MVAVVQGLRIFMLARITALYIELVFRRPLLVIALVLITAAGFGYYAQYFRLDASADSLMLEGDKDLEYSREINAIYGTSESVIIAYT
ncbi:MAG: putative RND superfamily exporter protein, partial [Pseudohongiellaceae bacterium]